ncbi:Fumarate hydratase class II [Streptomyces microflavus]
MGSCLIRSRSRERDERPSFPGYRCLPSPTAWASAASAAVRGSGGTPVRIALSSRALMSRLSGIERDSMGEVKVPAHAKWRAQTQRAVENFPISGQRLERAHIEALARIDGEAKVNAELKVVDPDIADAIQEAAAEVASGRWASTSRWTCSRRAPAPRPT